jgi:hypothetical protein
MNNTCETCRHYRPRASLVENVQRELQRQPADVSRTLAEGLKTEEELFKNEQLEEQRLTREEQTYWTARPHVSPYCGMEEVEDSYGVLRVKNPSRQCLDHVPATGDARECDSCKYYAAPVQYELDSEQLTATAWAEAWSRSQGQGMLSGAWGTASSKNESTLNFATAQALTSAKAGASYFSTCKKMSSRSELVLCAHANPRRACPFWVSPKSKQGQLEAENWLPAFTIMGVHFRQEYTFSGEQVLRVYGARFKLNQCIGLKYSLSALKKGDVFTLGGAGNGAIILRQLARTRTYTVHDDCQNFRYTELPPL